MRVCVVGTGYVGLVTGACLAHAGHSVVGIDNNAAKVEQLRSGRSSIYEPGLEATVQSAMAVGTLITTHLAAGVAHGDILFMAVGTPPLPTGESVTRYVEAVVRGIGLDSRIGPRFLQAGLGREVSQPVAVLAARAASSLAQAA